MEIATIGSLVSITKSLLDLVKGINSRISDNSIRQQLRAEFTHLYARMDDLSVQLDQSERLTRMVPAWLELANRMPLWQQPLALGNAEAQNLDRDMRSLLDNSIRDHFSSTFFDSQFDRLPDVPLKLEIFRERLRTLDRTVSTVQPGNTQSLEALWPQITTHFNDARNTAYEIQRLADDVHGRLINELRDAAKQGLAELSNA